MPNRLILKYFRSRNKFGMTVKRVDVPQQLTFGLKKFFTIKNITQNTVIPNLFRELKNLSIRTICCSMGKLISLLFRAKAVRGVFALTIFFFSAFLWADSSLEKQATALYQEVRCPVCLGQSIADSDTEESQSLKKFILERLKQGEEEDKIREELRTTFGDDILFHPPFGPHTLLLWMAPFGLFFLILLGFLWKTFRVRRKSPKGVILGFR